MNYKEYIGYLATILSSLSILPNLYSIIFKKLTHGFNYLYGIIGLLAQICWLIFGLYKKNKQIIFVSIFLGICYSLILFYKFYYETTRQNVFQKLNKNLSFS